MVDMARADDGGLLYDPFDLTDGGHLEDVYRMLARRFHPDSVGGSHDQFVKLQAAYKLAKEAEPALTP